MNLTRTYLIVAVLLCLSLCLPLCLPLGAITQSSLAQSSSSQSSSARSSSAQSSIVQPAAIEGRITDAETGLPLQGASVFLASTMHGSSTNNEGAYRIPGVQTGVYMLVVSMVGFETSRQEIRVFPGDEQVNKDVALVATAYELAGVEVTGKKDRRWARRYDRFKRLLIGTSERAKGTSLLNREVLDFEVDAAGRMKAMASAPLLFENRALGYRITYTMQEFLMDPQARILRYQGEPFFEEMVPRSEKEAAEWKVRRKEAYLGSMGHLFSSILRDSTFEEHFLLYQGFDEEPVSSGELLVTASQEITFENPLKIVYTRRTEKENRKFSLIRRSISEETSYFYLHVPAVLINADGYYAPPEALTATGALGDRRLADLVPRDYPTTVARP